MNNLPDFSIDNSAYQNLPITDTNMHVGLIANSEKLISETNRWNFKKGDNNPELDDDHTNYLNNSDKERNNSDKDKNNTFSNNRSEVKNTERNNSDNNRNTNTFESNNNNNMSNEELMQKKLDMLRKLTELSAAGVTLSQNYSMNSDLKMMENEYNLHKGIRAKQNGINWLSSMTLNCIYGLEMLNDKYDPFELKLKGWSEQMSADINNYYDVFGELYEKYNQPGKNMPPELKLILMISGSALKFHLTNSLLNAGNENETKLNTTVDNDPVLKEQLRQKALANKKNELLKKKQEEEHLQANIKLRENANDLALIRQKELEHENLVKNNSKQAAEIEKLKRNLTLNNNNQIQHHQVNQVQQPQVNQIQQQNLASQATMRVNPLVQQMLNKQKLEQQQKFNQLQQSYGLANQTLVDNKINNLNQQVNYVEKLEEIKNTKSDIESDNMSKFNSDTSSDSSNSSKSSNKSKIESIGVVDPDEISQSNISFGRKKTPKKQPKKDDTKEDKPKKVRQKKRDLN